LPRLVATHFALGSFTASTLSVLVEGFRMTTPPYVVLSHQTVWKLNRSPSTGLRANG